MSNLEKTEGFNKSVINWYPGHMAKTKRLIKEKYDLIDIVYEIIDARIPASSKIKDIASLIKDKPKLLIMTKSDLCDMKETLKWQQKYESDGYKVVIVDLTKNNSTTEIVNITHEIMKPLQDKRKEKGLSEKQIRALVIGIPHVGKSTLINRLAGKKVAVIGNNPGVTKNLSWLKTTINILLERSDFFLGIPFIFIRFFSLSFITISVLIFLSFFKTTLLITEEDAPNLIISLSF